MVADGADHVWEDGTRVTPFSTICGSEEAAIRQAPEANVDRIDKIERLEWFTVGGSRKVRYPREKSPALTQARAAAEHTERLPLGIPYPQVAQRVEAVVANVHKS